MDAPREIPVDPVQVPPGVADAVHGYAWARDTVGEAGAEVHRLHAPDRPTLYLKHGRGQVAQDVLDEAARLRWLDGRTRVPKVLRLHASADDAWLLMTALPGATAFQHLEDAPPEARRQVVTALAEHLRHLHALPAAECPFNAAHPLRLAQAKRRMDAGGVDVDDFGEAHEGWSAEQVWREMTGLLPLSPDPVVTHGDYSLDNILMQDGRVTGCIDLGRAGVADRHQDLAILWNCLAEFDQPDLQPLWLRAYGVARANRRKLRFHLCLDEFF